MRYEGGNVHPDADTFRFRGDARRTPAVPLADWRHRGACSKEDPELFSPPDNTRSRSATQQIAKAKAVCHGCPVATECLHWALRAGEERGIWGGLSGDERQALKRRNARNQVDGNR
ncbi:MAG: WhiB family transcriptional regulator [Candidatus Levyibacteriota bacterium]